MLILTRQIGEILMIGNDVSVKILGVRGGQVKIGIDAPREVEIYRDEIYWQIKEGVIATDKKTP